MLSKIDIFDFFRKYGKKNDFSDIMFAIKYISKTFFYQIEFFRKI